MIFHLLNVIRVLWLLIFNDSKRGKLYNVDRHMHSLSSSKRGNFLGNEEHEVCSFDG